MVVNPKGRFHSGQRPGTCDRTTDQALIGRPNHFQNRVRSRFGSPLQGLYEFGHRVPRTLLWAAVVRPVGAEENFDNRLRVQGQELGGAKGNYSASKGVTTTIGSAACRSTLHGGCPSSFPSFPSEKSETGERLADGTIDGRLDHAARIGSNSQVGCVGRRQR